MAKDPRFNFYVDNYIGGTRRFTFEQKGAYIDLLCIQFYAHNDELPGFTEAEALAELSKPAASAAAHPAALWDSLKIKFKTDGNYFYNERLRLEFLKSKTSSIKQSERAKSRYGKDAAANAAGDACNGISIGNRILIFIENVKNENLKREKKLTEIDIENFINYWTEKNPGGSKLKFEMQKVFEINKRLTTWYNNNLKFKNGHSKNNQSNSRVVETGTTKKSFGSWE